MPLVLSAENDVDEPIERFGDGTLDDATLVRLVQARDEGAFRLLYERYRVPLMRSAYRFVRSVAVAEDLVQTLFTNVWMLGPAWRVRTTPQAYLFRWVRHLAGRYCERADREVGTVEADREARIGVVPDSAEQRPVGAIRQPSEPSTSNAGEAKILVEELVRIFEQTVAALPEPGQSIYRLAREQRMSYDEIADVMGMIPNRVRQHIIAVHRELDRRLKSAGWSDLVLQGGILGARTDRPRSAQRRAGGDRGE
jgi:RNA polymerase sigma factor (sigma-70 family)